MIYKYNGTIAASVIHPSGSKYRNMTSGMMMISVTSQRLGSETKQSRSKRFATIHESPATNNYSHRDQNIFSSIGE